MRALIVVDIGFGDAAKGATVDYLVDHEKSDLVVFFNGGAQRAHNVVMEDGLHHTFSQFGSGTFRGADTYHSRYSMVNPLNLITEGWALNHTKGVSDPFGMVRVDGMCPIITPYHVATNRLREIARDTGMHGSCGQGIGETAHDHERGLSLFAWALLDYDVERLTEWLEGIRERKREELADVSVEDLDDRGFAELATLADRTESRRCAEAYKAFSRLVEIVDTPDLSEHEVVVFEGSQGVLIDERHGFPPYHTWSNCTFENAMALIAPYDNVDVSRIGVTRAYGVRHGPGPFPTEILGGAPLTLTELHNGDHPWQGPFRSGYTDLMLLRYAVDACGGIDTVAVTCLDQLPDEWQIATSYIYDGEQLIHYLNLNPAPTLETQSKLAAFLMGGVTPLYERCTRDELPSLIGQVLDAPVAFESWGPTAADRRLRTDSYGG